MALDPAGVKRILDERAGGTPSTAAAARPLMAEEGIRVSVFVSLAYRSRRIPVVLGICALVALIALFSDGSGSEAAGTTLTVNAGSTIG